MAKSLVIVESPAKAKTINKYLGKDFVVKSSVGHVRDLPTRATETIKSKPAAEVRKMSPDAKAKYQKERDYKRLIARMGLTRKMTGKRITRFCREKKKSLKS